MSQKPDDTSPLPGPALPPVRVASHGLTDRGMVREGNEDHFLIGELARTLWIHQSSLPQAPTQYGRNRGHVFLVADGMGGHQAGEVASALTVTTIEAFVLHLLRRFSNLQDADEQGVLGDFQTALRDANTRIFEESANNPEFRGMGTTLTLAFASNWKLFVVHAGDSRCYLFRNGRLGQLTQDHTWVGEMVRQGILAADKAEDHPYRHVVTNVVGGNVGDVHVELRREDLEPGDVILLCSDGLTDMLHDGEIAAVLEEETSPRAACEHLVDHANENGGKDNITVVVARFDAA